MTCCVREGWRMITKEPVMDELAGPQRCSACSQLPPYILSEEEWHQNRCGLKSPENFSRIHIIGGPGSGKTTLARQIGAYLGIETYELDHIAFTGPDFMERPFPARLADIHQIATGPAWISEGIFVQWTEELLAQANIIVWLDNVRWERGIWRITRRFFHLAAHEAQQRQGLQRYTRFQDYFRHIRQYFQVVISSHAYYTGNPARPVIRLESRSSTEKFLIPYQDKVIHCYRDEAVGAFIEYIRVCHENL